MTSWMSKCCLGGSAKSKGGEKKAIKGKKKKGQVPKPVDNTFYGPRIFTYKELTAATKEFSSDELLGRGAFGSVYKGSLGDGSIVAVKQIAHDSNQGEREFLAEVSIISRIRHRNLVQLQGWCHERGNLLLVYDYMPQGSLDKMLEGSGENSSKLGWDVRHSVLKGVACALSYLHEECQQCVLHRDIKPSNVLLDENFSPHLADFGLARLIHHTTSNVQTKIIAGTRGYLAPELIQVGKASTKSDVFSFGVLVLEVATGKRPLDKNKPENENLGLVNSVWRAHEANDILRMSDPKLQGAHDPQRMTTLLQMGLFCCHPDPEARPPMSYVRQWFIQEVPLPRLPPTKPRVTYVTNPPSPATLALPAPEVKLAIEGPPPKALAIEAPPPKKAPPATQQPAPKLSAALPSNGTSKSTSPADPRSPALRSPSPTTRSVKSRSPGLPSPSQQGDGTPTSINSSQSTTQVGQETTVK